MARGSARQAAVERALRARRESTKVAFVAGVDPASPTEWCGLARELAAMANSGGGVVVVGVDARGEPSGWDASFLLSLDQRALDDELRRCTDPADALAATPVEATRSGATVVVLPVDEAAGAPLLVDGTVYVRHGARTEPARAADLRRFVTREVRRVRREWLANVALVTHAPPGSQVVVHPPGEPAPVQVGTEFRVVDDPKAPTVGRTDFDRTHPFREVEVVRMVNEALGQVTVGHYDVQCVRRVYDVDHQERYYHRPKFGSPQYSQAFVDWLVGSYRHDPEFFTDAKARDQARRAEGRGER
jgi:hypothetical protein